VSVSTLAGRAAAEKRLAGAARAIFYAPFDLVWAVRRVLRTLKPSVVVVLETEIWPSLFREARRIGCGLIIVNGRISDRALPRYRRFPPLFSAVLALCDRSAGPSDEMRPRYIDGGAPPGMGDNSGNRNAD